MADPNPQHMDPLEIQRQQLQTMQAMLEAVRHLPIISSKLDDVTRTLEEVKAENQAIRSENQALNAKLEEVRVENVNLNVKLEDVKAENVALNAKLEQVRDGNVALKVTMGDVKDELVRSRRLLEEPPKTTYFESSVSYVRAVPDLSAPAEPQRHDALKEATSKAAEGAEAQLLEWLHTQQQRRGIALRVDSVNSEMAHDAQARTLTVKLTVSYRETRFPSHINLEECGIPHVEV